MNGRPAHWAGAVAASLVLGLSSCGDTSKNAVVVRVGGSAITKAIVDRWTNVVQHGGVFAGFRGTPSGSTPRQRALALLISSDWLIGEAARKGSPVSAKAVDEALAERMGEPSRNEFRSRLATSGQTLAGVKLEIEAELALEVISRQVMNGADRFARPELLSFYRKNPQLFGAFESREVDLLDKLPSKAAASTLAKRVGPSDRFARLAYRKIIRKSPGVFTGTATKKNVDYAIFAARPGVISQPMRLEAGWALFVVRRIFPARLEPLATIRSIVVAKWEERHAEEVARVFDHQYTTYWRSKTTCRAEYLAPGCPQFHGQLGPYEDPFSSRVDPVLSEQGASG
jgi:hypothetical protein